MIMRTDPKASIQFLDGTWDSPARLNETTSEFFKRLATISPPEEAAWYRNPLDPKVQAELRVKKPQYYSMLRTSVVPTIVRGGFRENVIPAEAEATLDVRALPDENMDELMATLRNLINMQTQVTRTARPPSDRS